MPYTPPTVNYSTTQNGTYTTLTGIQSVQITRGRTYFQNNFQASSLQVELIPATSYATPLAIGQYIDVRVTNSATSRAFFCGQITDVQRTYEIPYTSATGYAPGDRIIINATGATGIMAQYTFPSGALPGLPSGVLTADTVTNQLSQLGTLANVYFVPSVASVINGSAITLAGQGAFDVANKIARTGQQIIDDGDNQRNTLGTYGSQLLGTSYPTGTVTATFSDSGAIRYNQLAFQSTAQSTFNQVNVYPDGLATQSTSGTAPYNSLDYYTNNATTADGLSLSGLLYNLFNTLTTVAPFQLGTTTAVDDTWLPVAYITDNQGNRGYLGGGASITFRGATYTAQIQSINVNFYPDQATLYLNLSPSLGQAFTLNSSNFGILNTNRLGYP